MKLKNQLERRECGNCIAVDGLLTEVERLNSKEDCCCVVEAVVEAGYFNLGLTRLRRMYCLIGPQLAVGAV